VKFRRVIFGLLGLVVVAGAGAFIYAWKPAISPISPPERESFDQELIEHGAVLAAVGNCIACHTQPGGMSFAGGFPIPTPFGTIYSTNITPDPDTGIGRWSEEAFIRAMREGVDREGRHLYPAFPYDHFTVVSDEDNRALYAFLMTRPAVVQQAKVNELSFPFNMRQLLAGWKLLFLDEGAYQDVASQSEEWNRGAYLVDGLGHCGACHTPRNAFGAERGDAYLAGGEAEGWSAFALNSENAAPLPWTRDSLYAYLRRGWHADHGVASGPMGEVTGNLGLLSDADIGAMASYLASLMGEPSEQRKREADSIRELVAAGPIGVMPVSTTQEVADTSVDRGAAIYRAACFTCHDGSKPQPFGGINLRLSTTLNAPDSQNAVNAVLFGLPAASGRQSAIMPGFAATMDDQQVVDLLTYLRREFAGKPAWTDVEKRVAATRSGEYPVSVRPSDGIERGPANIGARDK
jgi:mono/diheme cytochrome c family protein